MFKYLAFFIFTLVSVQGQAACPKLSSGERTIREFKSLSTYLYKRRKLKKPVRAIRLMKSPQSKAFQQKPGRSYIVEFGNSKQFCSARKFLLAQGRKSCQFKVLKVSRIRSSKCQVKLIGDKVFYERTVTPTRIIGD